MKKVLVIEDESILRTTLVRKMENDGHEVYSAENGKIGKKLIVLHRPDLIITDMMMPDLGGRDVICFVRDILKWNTPIIVVTVLENEIDVLDAFDIGANDYVTKPFSLKELTIRVDKQLKCICYDD